jgi:hypothetical protein
MRIKKSVFKTQLAVQLKEAPPVHRPRFKFKFKNFIVQLKIHLNAKFPFAALE